jgi:hypothetical protein
MDKLLSEKTKQVKTILSMLNKAELSDSGHVSTKQPFFLRGKSNEFKIDYKPIPELPKELNRHFKLFYEIVGEPDKEVYIGEWTFISLNEALSQYKQYCSDGQSNVFNIGYKYAGMGHIEVLSCNLYNHLLFIRMDGGSSGWDREYNYKKLLEFNYKEYEYFYFNQFLKML